MKKKIKAEFFLPGSSSDEKVKDDMALTPQERLSLAFRLADLAREIRPDKILPSSNNDGIFWYELKCKNGSTRKRIQKD